MDEKKSNIFTDLFPKKKQSADDSLIQSVNASTNISEILQPKMQDDKELLVYEKPTMGFLLLKIAVLFTVFSFLYFYSQLSPSFSMLGTNPVQERESLFNEILKDQSKINVQNLTLAKYALDDYLFTADIYLHKVSQYKSPLTTKSKKAELEKEFVPLVAQMKESLMLAKDLFAKDLLPQSMPNYWVEDVDLRNLFASNAKDELRKYIVASNEDVNEAELLRSVSKLLDSAEAMSLVESLNVQTMKDKDFEELVVKLNELETGAFATLNLIRGSRISWTGIITEIEKITKNIDPLFATKILSQKVGEIFYTSYAFNQKSNTVSVVGETVSDDGSNFTVSANLIDAFENSKFFEGVTMNSYSKAKEGEEGFVGVLNLQFKLTDL